MIEESHSEIVICPYCKGSGNEYIEKCISYHKGEYDYEPVVCAECEGKGRLRKETSIIYTKINYSNSSI